MRTFLFDMELVQRRSSPGSVVVVAPGSTDGPVFPRSSHHPWGLDRVSLIKRRCERQGGEGRGEGCLKATFSLTKSLSSPLGTCWDEFGERVRMFAPCSPEVLVLYVSCDPERTSGPRTVKGGRYFEKAVTSSLSFMTDFLRRVNFRHGSQVHSGTLQSTVLQHTPSPRLSQPCYEQKSFAHGDIRSCACVSHPCTLSQMRRTSTFDSRPNDSPRALDERRPSEPCR
ncbi:hypothetical protein LIA77_01423 [Sarocladium implicatum]|nr:hypothetical protein LIA77_01423 [Sarocladium implicatum]